MDFQILLSFYRNMNLHMWTAHTRFGCTAPTGNRVMALCYFQIYIVDCFDCIPLLVVLLVILISPYITILC